MTFSVTVVIVLSALALVTIPEAYAQQFELPKIPQFNFDGFKLPEIKLPDFAPPATTTTPQPTAPPPQYTPPPPAMNNPSPAAPPIADVGLLPDNGFYGFKKFFENIDVFFTPDPVDKAEKQLAIAETRLAEAVIMAEQGKDAYVPQLVAEYNDNLASAGATIESIPAGSVEKAEITTRAAELVSDDTAVFSDIQADVAVEYHYALNIEKTEAIALQESITSDVGEVSSPPPSPSPNNDGDILGNIGGYLGGGGGGAGSTVDTTRPVVAITSPVNGTIFLVGNVAIKGIASDDVAPKTIQASLNNGAFTSLQVQGTTDWTYPLAQLPEGSYVITIRALDAAGNIGMAAVLFFVDATPDPTPDNTPPNTTITKVTGSDNSPISVGGITSHTTAIFTFGGSDNVGITRIEGNFDGEGFKTITSPKILTGIPLGGHTYTIRAVDIAGNVDPTPASFSWTVITVPDLTLPSVSITSPTPGVTVSGTIQARVTASDNVGVKSVSAFVDGTQIVTQNQPPYDFTINTTTFADGSHKLKATAFDTSNNAANHEINFNINNTISTPPPDDAQVDPFGVRMIYPTRISGEQWYFDMTDGNDVRFDPQNSITKNADGSWKMKSDQVRMNVFTSVGYHPDRIESYDQKVLAAKGYMQDANDWKNIEMTGYVKLNKATTDDDFVWYARGGKHTDSNGGCEGSSYKGDLGYDGTVRFAKEQQHADGYSFSKTEQAVASLHDRWIGFKTVMYNDKNNDVVLQLFVNDNADKVTWEKVYDIVDAGGWGTEGDLCGGEPDQKITWGGPIATFRYDNASDVDFEFLSVREIAVPV